MSKDAGLDVLAEEVAKAQRAVNVAGALRNDYRSKLRLAEEELADAERHLSNTQNVLSQAAVAVNKETHGAPLSLDDQTNFERRWDVQIAELMERRERRNQFEDGFPAA